LVASKADAADWHVITKTPNSDVYIDRESVAPRGKYMRAWLRYEYHKPERMEAPPQKEYSRGLTLWAFDCKERTVAVIRQMLFFGEDTAPVAEHTVPWALASFTDIPPDSIGETVFQTVCSPKQKPRK
jgi:hypothetical protein